MKIISLLEKYWFHDNDVYRLLNAYSYIKQQILNKFEKMY